MTIKALIFDFDGLILNTEEPAFESWQMIYRDHGADLDLALWQANIGTVDLFDTVAHLETLVGRSLDRVAVLEQRQAYKEALSVDLVVLPGVRELLEAAVAAGLRLGLASSSDRAWIQHWLQRHDLARYFNCVRTRDDVDNPKPAPDLYLSAAAGLGVPPEQCVALEDSPNGLRAALAAGMRCVVVPTAITAALDYSGAAFRLTSLAELPLPQLLERLAVGPDD
jgi:HAD superfamily hydrolase (TIGR01509 family)